MNIFRKNHHTSIKLNSKNDSNPNSISETPDMLLNNSFDKYKSDEMKENELKLIS